MASVIEYLALLPDYVVDKIADRLTGIAAQSQYLPTIADLKVFADRAMEDRAKEIRYSRLQGLKPSLPPPRTRFRPFPKLWQAFADDQHTIDKLDASLPFDTLFDASKALATKGKPAALAILWRGDTYPQPVDTHEAESQAA